jgi:hypothetical protein
MALKYAGTVGFETLYWRTTLKLDLAQEMRICRIMGSGFSPTVDDILRSRVRTTGIVEISFKLILRQAMFSTYMHMRRVMGPGFSPTVDDILRSRVRTTGIVEISFKHVL